jgi:hypothetical protein
LYYSLQKRNSEGGKQGGSVKKTKKDKFVGANVKNVKTETSMVSAAPRVKPELTLPATYVFNPFVVIFGHPSSNVFICGLFLSFRALRNTIFYFGPLCENTIHVTARQVQGPCLDDV